MAARELGQKTGIRYKTQDSRHKTQDTRHKIQRSKFWHVLRFVFCALCLLSCIILLNPSMCFSQTFGKNKVSSRQFDWMTYKTTHFVIHYYPDEERLVDFAGVLSIHGNDDSGVCE